MAEITSPIMLDSTGQAIVNAINNISLNTVKKADIVDNLTSTATDKPLSANQGKVLNDKIDGLIKTKRKQIDFTINQYGYVTLDFTDIADSMNFILSISISNFGTNGGQSLSVGLPYEHGKTYLQGHPNLSSWVLITFVYI